MTATSLGPGLTEVLVFGGSVKWPLLKGNTIAETTILKFGEQLLHVVHAAMATIVL